MLLSLQFQLYWSGLLSMSCIVLKRNSCTDSFLNFLWHGNSHSRFHGEKYWCVIGILDWCFNSANARATGQFRDSEYTNVKTLLGHFIFWIQAWQLVKVLAFTWVKHGPGDFWNTLVRWLCRVACIVFFGRNFLYHIWFACTCVHPWHLLSRVILVLVTGRCCDDLGENVPGAVWAAPPRARPVLSCLCRWTDVIRPTSYTSLPYVCVHNGACVICRACSYMYVYACKCTVTKQYCNRYIP